MDKSKFSTAAYLRKLRGTDSQEAMAEKLMVSRKTIIRYEAGEAVPDAEVLLKLNVLYKADPLHVLTGLRPDTSLVGAEKLLLDNYRAADESGKNLIEGTAKLAAKSGGKSI